MFIRALFHLQWIAHHRLAPNSNAEDVRQQVNPIVYPRPTMANDAPSADCHHPETPVTHSATRSEACRPTPNRMYGKRGPI